MVACDRSLLLMQVTKNDMINFKIQQTLWLLPFQIASLLAMSCISIFNILQNIYKAIFSSHILVIFNLILLMSEKITKGKYFSECFLGSFHTIDLFLCPLKTSENMKISDVCQRYRKRPVVLNGLRSNN